MLDYTKVESRLKSFLKNNKKLGYSVALLVSFLINGGFSYAVETRAELRDKIVQEQDNVSQMLKDADKSISNIELKIKKLTQRGEFWVKPLERSYQVAFITSFGNYTKNRNRTDQNFTEPEYNVPATNGQSGNSGNRYVVDINGITVLANNKATTGNSSSYRGSYNYNGRNLGEYGIVKNPLEFVDKIDFGANITPKAVTEKTVVVKTVSETKVTEPKVSVSKIDVSRVTVTPPAAPIISAPANPGNPSVNVTAPGAITPLGTITVAAIPAINVSVATPTVGTAPTVSAPTVATPPTPAGFSPKLISAPNKPAAPDTPTINLFNPFNISFNGAGFGQPTGKAMVSPAYPTGVIMLQNYNTYNTTGTTITSGMSTISTSGAITTESGTLSAQTVTNFSPAFISHVDDYDVNLNGNYKFIGSGINGGNTRMFVSVNPYETGRNTSGDKTFKVNGTVTLEGTGGDGTEAIVGLEHQLLANGPGGGEGFTNITNSSTTHRLEIGPTGVLNLSQGSNMVGIMVDTEYIAGTSGSNFVKLPQTVNNGKILIGSGASKSVGIDYGFYFSHAPNSTVHIGTMEVDGTNNYGVRLKSYYGLSPLRGPGNGNVYYDLTRLEGTAGKSITVKGTKNIGISIGQGRSSGDPLGGYGHLGNNGSADNADLISGLNITVGGKNNVGFYRNPNYEGNNHSIMELNSSRIGEFKFTSDAEESTLFRSDFDEIKLTKNITLTDGKTGNSFMQAGSTVANRAGTVTNAAVLTSSLKTFYGLTAGNFVSSTGAIATNTGTLKLTGENSIGMAIAASNTGNNSGKIEVTGKSGVGIYNKGVFNVKDNSEIVIEGKKSSGIYTVGPKVVSGGNATAGLTNITGTTQVKISANKGAVGIYATNKGEVTSTAGDKLLLTSGSGEGLAAYAENGGVINLEKSKITVTDSSAGAASFGTNGTQKSLVNLKEATLTYKGNGYAVYSDGIGQVNLEKTTINLLGSSTAFDVDLGATTLPTILDTNTRINVKSDDVVVFNLKRATNLTTVGGIETSIKSKIETKLGLGANSLNNLFTGSTATKYKVAAVDGGTITIGNLDKSGISTDTVADKKDGFQYFNRFLAQRLVATAKNSTIKAVLTTADATARYNGQVTGFEMNSSKNATTNAEAAINLVSSKIIADRNGAGDGAVGAFINYGKVSVDNKSSIEVETQTGNNANDKAVGVYAVNGSEVSNAGTIKVGGKQSVGILGMAYRLDAKNKLVVDEFGSKATNQGKVTITNTKDITMTGENSIGIYANNNKTGSAVTNHIVTNSGTITVGKSSGASTAVAIYADKVTVKPENGTLKIAEGAVGVYATPKTIVGEVNKNLGTIHFTGKNAVGIYLKGTTADGDSILRGNKLTLKEDKGTTTGKIGIFYDLQNAQTSNIEIDAANANNVIAYYTKNKDLTVKAPITLGQGSVGMTGTTGKKFTYGDDTSATTNVMTLGKNSTGIYGDSTITIGAKTNIKLQGESAIGAYAKGANGLITSKGTLIFTKEKSTGLYAANGAKIVEVAGANSKLDFSAATAKNNTGIYLAGANWEGRTIAYTFDSDHSKKNIYLFAQGSKDGATVRPSNLVLKNEFKVSPTGTASGSNKTIGMYLDTAVKGGSGASAFAANILDLTAASAKVTAEKGGIGVYAKNNSAAVDNIIKRINVSSTGKASVGIFADGNIKLDQANGKITAANQGIGVYGNKGKITLGAATNLETSTQGTGIYLTNGSYITGSKLTLKNTGTAAAGVYYTKGSNANEVTHGTELAVNSGSNLLALYLDNGVKVKNNADITVTAGSKNVGAFVTKGSTLTNDKTIKVGAASGYVDGMGIYVQHGTATNNAGKSIEVLDNSASSVSVAMAANGAAAATSATIVNKGDIKASGDAIGMNVGGYSTGTNTGKIIATDRGNLKAIGAYVNGANAKFTNSGTISSDNIALALKDTKAGNVTSTGSLKLTKNNAVGVYADNSAVNFAVTPVTTNNGTVALYAKGNTTVNSKITSATGKGHVGVYVADSKVTFGNASSVVVGNGVNGAYGVGVFTKEGYNGTIKTTITQNGDKTIGLYAGNKGTSGSKINHEGTMNIGRGVGVFVPQNSSFIAKNSVLNVNGGTAIFLKGGSVDLGATGKATINFGANGGTAIYQESGTINTGANLKITGKGSFLALKNANSTINSVVSVGANAMGINAIYDKAGTNYALTIGNAGKFQLNGTKATGLSATVKGVLPNKVTVVNKGIIETLGTNTETTGIIANGASVQNIGKINIGTKGAAIYATNDGTDKNTQITNTGEINLIGNEAKGIVGIKVNTNQNIVVGKITGTKDQAVGAYFKNSNTVNIRDAKVNLATNAKGLVFDTTNFNISATSGKNLVNVGGTTDNTKRAIGIAAIGSSGTVTKTDITVGSSATGKQSMGLYAQGGTLTYDSTTGDLKATGNNAILAYADAAGTINLNGGKTLNVGAGGIGVGAKGGKVLANKATVIQVNGAEGIGAYVNGGNISPNFDIKVKAAKGRGVYATGNVLSVAKVSELRGTGSIAYVLENVINHVAIPNAINLTDTVSTGQFGVVAMGRGNGLTVNNISVVGNSNIGVSSTTGKAVINNGTLKVANSIANKTSIGIYSKGGTITNKGTVTVGNNSLGIYGEKSSVTTGALTVSGNKGVGISLNNKAGAIGNVVVNGNVSVGANQAVGIQVSKANVTVNNLTVGNGDSKGIYADGAGNVTARGNVVVGNDSVGIYQKAGTGIVRVGTANNTMKVGDKGYGVLSQGSAVINNSNITVGKEGIGIYVNGNNLTSKGTVTVGTNGVGLFLKGAGKTLTSEGLVTVATNNSIGVYADGANIRQKGGMKIGDTSKASGLSSSSTPFTGIGIYSKGNGNIDTDGDMIVGYDSIGVYKNGKGIVNVGSASGTDKLAVANKGYGIYHMGGTSSDSIINSKMSLSLGKEGIGIYGKNTTVNQAGNIKVGETTIGNGGFSNPNKNKNSIGIFADNSNVNYTGTMTVDKPLSVGIYAANGGNVTLKNGAVLNIKNGATGVMTGKGVTAVTVDKGAVINVNGKANHPSASKNNVSFGIAAYSGVIDNKGTINLTNGATGIYLGGTAKLKNGATGVINIGAGGGTSIGTPGGPSKADVGGVLINNAGKITINEKVVTAGQINITGSLNMSGMGIDITGRPIIDAHSIGGVAFVEPNFSKGNSVQAYVIPDVFRTSAIGTFSGDVQSRSVSWIAKITQGSVPGTTTKDITVARIPYQSLIQGVRYAELAKGMEGVRTSISKNSSSEIFKSLDKIETHKEFGRSVAELRGDVYSNLQERMKTVESAFDKSYDELLTSYNKTRNVIKFSVIHTRGKHEDSTLGVTGYKYNTTGALYVNDREGFTYGGKYGWSAGVVGTRFEFNDETNSGSKEKVVSGKLGVHYQTPLNSYDDNARLKWLTRGELTVNDHRTKRHSTVNGDVYVNKAHFYSTEISWKNKVYYEHDINTKWTVTPYAGLDLSYGHVSKIREKGNELNLEVKAKDYFAITPNIGVETKYTVPVGLTHQAFAKLDAELDYDVAKLYTRPNMAKIKDANTGYYKLSEPERRTGRVTVGAELGFEKENTYGVSFRAEYQGHKKSDINYGVKLNYKF
ncbi:autotransporter-associated N-terminal domain-containing protein [Fusobacterium polymorphum]|uniref:autotransporter adhesin RadD n=1 Tax=Fusobacterium nucleatum subsp. polymorphum TaxID=76857 RepID=UPI0030CD4F4C